MKDWIKPKVGPSFLNELQAAEKEIRQGMGRNVKAIRICKLIHQFEEAGGELTQAEENAWEKLTALLEG
jgi:hypothetical protein